MIDLHIHTTASDGEHSPSEVVEMAENLGITTISITDHNSVKGIEEAIKSAKNKINLIPGVEITAYDGREIHVLGYYIDYKSEMWKEYYKYNEDVRTKEENNIIKILNNMGIKITREDVYKYSNSKMFKNSNVAKWLYAEGYGESAKEIYNDFFVNGPLENIKEHRISVGEAINFIHLLGGKAIFAHPCRLGKIDIDEAEKLIEKYKKLGLDGVEAIYCMHTDEQTEELIPFCKSKQLIITLGSDYHGETIKPAIKLGHGINNNLDKYQNVEVEIY